MQSHGSSGVDISLDVGCSVESNLKAANAKFNAFVVAEENDFGDIIV